MEQVRVGDIHLVVAEQADETGHHAQPSRAHQGVAEASVDDGHSHLLDGRTKLAMGLEGAHQRREAPPVEPGEELNEVRLRPPELEMVDHVHHADRHGATGPARAP